MKDMRTEADYEADVTKFIDTINKTINLIEDELGTRLPPNSPLDLRNSDSLTKALSLKLTPYMMLIGMMIEQEFKGHGLARFSCSITDGKKLHNINVNCTTSGESKH